MNEKVLCTEDGLAVKTLFLKSLAKDLRRNQLFDYFSTFGPLQSVRIHFDDTNSFGFVQFEGEEAAAIALEMKHHEIDGRKIEVEIADDCHQYERTANDELPIELTNATGTEFMSLNDYCLREILTRVTAMDLCSLLELSRTSKNFRLEAITSEIFARKYKSIELNNVTATADEVERLLANFGSLISAITTEGHSRQSGHPDDTRTISSIIQWCSGTLTRLDLKKYKFSENETKLMKAVFANLTELQIVYCRFEGDAEALFASCKSLTHLTVYGPINVKKQIFQQTYSELKIFFGADFAHKINYNFEDFISRHKKLTMIGLLSIEDQSAILPIMAANCTQLHTLAISTKSNENPAQYQISIKSVSELKNLKRLAIRDERNATEFMRQLKDLKSSLIELSLDQVHFVPGTVSALIQLRMLEILNIEYCPEFTDLDRLANLCRLKSLRVASNEVVKFDLVYMVNRLANLEKFVLDVKDFTISKEVHDRIVYVRTKWGKRRNSLEVVCNGTVTRFPK